MTSESVLSSEFLGALGSGLPAGRLDGGGRHELRPQSFLLAPGGQDYVGDNSYDRDARSLAGSGFSS